MSTTTRRYTYADLRDTPDDGNRYEIIDGELIVSVAPLVVHQWFLYLLSRRFGDHVDSRKLGARLVRSNRCPVFDRGYASNPI